MCGHNRAMCWFFGKQVRFQEKNPDFRFKNPDFLSGILISDWKNLEFIIKTQVSEGLSPTGDVPVGLIASDWGGKRIAIEMPSFFEPFCCRCRKKQRIAPEKRWISIENSRIISQFEALPSVHGRLPMRWASLLYYCECLLKRRIFSTVFYWKSGHFHWNLYSLFLHFYSTSARLFTLFCSLSRVIVRWPTARSSRTAQGNAPVEIITMPWCIPTRWGQWQCLASHGIRVRQSPRFCHSFPHGSHSFLARTVSVPLSTVGWPLEKGVKESH